MILSMYPSKSWAWPLYVVTLGLFEFWRRRHHFVLTNQRVVVAKGIINTREKSVPLSRIQDARLERSVLSGGKVYISTAGSRGPALAVGDPGQPLDWSDAVAFADELTPLIGKQPDGL